MPCEGPTLGSWRLWHQMAFLYSRPFIGWITIRRMAGIQFAKLWIRVGAKLMALTCIFMTTATKRPLIAVHSDCSIVVLVYWYRSLLYIWIYIHYMPPTMPSQIDSNFHLSPTLASLIIILSHRRDESLSVPAQTVFLHIYYRNIQLVTRFCDGTVLITKTLPNQQNFDKAGNVASFHFSQVRQKRLCNRCTNLYGDVCSKVLCHNSWYTFPDILATSGQNSYCLPPTSSDTCWATIKIDGEICVTPFQKP